MKLLITADLHLTDKPSEVYRWSAFDKMHSVIDTMDPKAVVILGDLTEKKDHHSSLLINTFIEELLSLAKKSPVYILQGNHDYTTGNLSTFEFLSNIRGITFVSERTTLKLGSLEVVFVPHNCYEFDGLQDNVVFAHHDFTGAHYANGMKVTGVNNKVANVVISGHIHLPQTTGNVTYCGAPHPVDFGDDFQPRMLLFDTKDSSIVDINLESIQRRMLKITCAADLAKIKVKAGDQVKAVVHLQRHQFCDWASISKEIRTFCTDNGVQLFGLELREVGSEHKTVVTDVKSVPDNMTMFEMYCEEKKIKSKLFDLGRDIVTKCS